GDDHVRVTRDPRDLSVASREHHELGVRRDDERAVMRIEAPKDHVGGASEIDPVEADPEDIDALPASTARDPAFHAVTLVDRDETPPEEVEVLEREAGAFRDAVERVLRDVA